jgi:hypothetical protein
MEEQAGRPCDVSAVALAKEEAFAQQGRGFLHRNDGSAKFFNSLPGN